MIDLKSFRESKNIQQSDVAKATGLDRSRISKYETKKEISKTVEKAILKAYPSAKDFILDEPVIDEAELRVRYENSLNENENLKKINSLLEDKLELYERMLEMAKAINKGE